MVRAVLLMLGSSGAALAGQLVFDPILSICLVGLDLLFGKFGWFPWHLAG